MRIFLCPSFISSSDKGKQGKKKSSKPGSIVTIKTSELPASVEILQDEGRERGSQSSSGEYVTEFHYEEMLRMESLVFEDRLENPPKLDATLEDFDILKQIGSGQFANVMLVQHKRTQRPYAMKILNQASIVKSKLAKNVIAEKNYLYAVENPFLVKIAWHTRDTSKLYMVMDFVNGGDMFFHIQKFQKFSEPLAKFYAGQIVLAFEYLHNLNLIYRDLKPENITIDSQGYIKLVDFGFVKRVPGKTYTLVGTPDYFAPEIILSRAYNKAVDWWALGVLIYEMLTGFPPFHDEEQMKTFEKIHSGVIPWSRTMSSEVKYLLKGLLQTNAMNRLGNLPNGTKDVKNHAWFSSSDWDWMELYNKRAIPPFLPKVSNEFDTRYFPNFPPDVRGINKNTTNAEDDPYSQYFIDF